MSCQETRGTGRTLAMAMLLLDLFESTDLEVEQGRPLIPFLDSLNFNELVARSFLRGCGMSPDQPVAQLMEEFSLPEDSLEMVAARIVDSTKRIRAAVERGDVIEAADESMRVGLTMQECWMKSRYEKPALLGEKICETARANAAHKREKQKRKADAWHRRARALAKSLREDNPDWGTTQVARVVKGRLNLPAAIRTIREVLSRE